MLAPALKTPELWTRINEIQPLAEMLGHFTYGT